MDLSDEQLERYLRDITWPRDTAERVDALIPERELSSAARARLLAVVERALRTRAAPSR